MRIIFFSKPSYPNLLSKINKKRISVGVVGVGYVGQALIEGMADSGIKSYGFDINKDKLRNIKNSSFTPVETLNQLNKCEVICICVPTPIDEFGKPDLTYLTKACENVSDFTGKPRLIIIESTVAPGTLRNVVLPLFERKGKKLGSNFYLAISPERIDPGNTNFNITNTPRVVGGVDKLSTTLATQFYATFIEKVVPTTSSEAAELSKMLENTFRLVNISLVNEIKEYADSIGVDFWEVIDAAATKPYAFMAHYPGPGVGGHCIPIDPVYLLEDAKNRGLDLKLTATAIKVNNVQPQKVVEKARESLNGFNRNRKPKLLVVGIAYKPNTSDTRESAGAKILEVAENDGFEVTYFDPYVPKLNGYTSNLLSPDFLNSQDVIIIATHHDNIPYELIAKIDKPIIDTRNVMSKYLDREGVKANGPLDQGGARTKGPYSTDLLKYEGEYT